MDNKLTDEQILDAIASEKVRQNDLIRKQNDEFRTTWGACVFTVPGRISYSEGVAKKGGAFLQAAMLAIMSYDEFDFEADPQADNSSALIEVEGHMLLWKIDLYDRDYNEASPVPHNPRETRRVLTVMLPEEY